MEMTDGICEIRARQVNAASLQARLHTDENKERISLVEQATIDRSHFLASSKLGSISMQFYEKFIPDQLSHDGVADFLQRTISTLPSRFHWLKQADISQITDLLNEIVVLRGQFVQKHGTLPSDGRIYREYRSILETAPDNDMRAHFNVVTLEALMNGDIMHGTLPSFSVE